MTNLIDLIVEFLPQGAVLYGGLSIFIMILLAEYVVKELNKKLMLPWMKQENLEKRKQLQQKNK
ncbi:hypothetical protein [Halalkalibacter krulwichiae]|uniref:Uncharacterized protein n=1 Tax=Halalkalibacter krulwichiae TaxID=199441 RepID=A0A1X9MC59_9BACI|nr:hypothetical protein [Halalkalibacter krulwichiae]ARK30180.1 hypothetical protein BkAM31D_10155 [Halalkalibacter krulwichiae]